MNILHRIPYTFLALIYVGWVGVDFYSFKTSDSSPLVAKRNELKSVETLIEAQSKKLEESKIFFQSLEAKRHEIRGLAQQLSEMKSGLNETIQIPAYLKTIVLEAKRSGLAVSAIQPGEAKREEFFGSQSFNMEFRGVYHQVLIFLDRIASLTEIIRVDDVDLKPLVAPAAQYIELEGKMKINVFQYIKSSADQVGQKGSANGS